MFIVFSIWHFLTGPQNSKSSKNWANDKPRFMTGLFYNAKLFLKTAKKGVSLHKTWKIDLIFTNMSYVYTNDSASEAKSCQCSSKHVVY